jgi:hypothetical protein
MAAAADFERAPATLNGKYPSGPQLAFLKTAARAPWLEEKHYNLWVWLWV